ncbi:MAG: hypothetical protein R3A44_08305 [Caldilineaceae bacterium]
MNKYVRCVKNSPYLQPVNEPVQTESLTGITIGSIYKVLSPEANDPADMLRIVDETFGEPGSECGYLYPTDYFEPFVPNGESRRVDAVTIHLDPYMKGVASRRSHRRR